MRHPRFHAQAPKGRPASAQGNALGIEEWSETQALKGGATLSPLQGSRVEMDGFS
jgi:hypothetical protein